jgi:hypothetical protein
VQKHNIEDGTKQVAEWGRWRADSFSPASVTFMFTLKLLYCAKHFFVVSVLLCTMPLVQSKLGQKVIYNKSREIIMYIVL